MLFLIALVVMGRLTLILAFDAIGWVVASWVAVFDHNDSLVVVMSGFTYYLLGGVILPFTLHEASHLVLATKAPGVSTVWVETTNFRISVGMEGEMSPLWLVGIAISRSCTCIALGLVIAAVGERAMSMFWLGHGLFLLPCFGDGRGLRRGLRTWFRSCDPAFSGEPITDAAETAPSYQRGVEDPSL
ncbi:hypothetical protein [Rothia uropygialis]|uniref:hypothetical protein n=1 Tax=Kocuria sp. 36 TaxID=1415402 RepID=UPI00101D4607|nr:hypothetical protein [Kocuria sp. 36]